ncbi:MAG: hypothetical protein R6V16_05740, partial [Bacteroidales bacterium]
FFFHHLPFGHLFPSVMRTLRLVPSSLPAEWQGRTKIGFLQDFVPLSGGFRGWNNESFFYSPSALWASIPFGHENTSFSSLKGEQKLYTCTLLSPCQVYLP